MSFSSIPPHLPFLETLADQVLARKEELADALILLPSRRNCRAFLQLLVERSTEGALVLPRIAPLGEVDEDALALEFALSGEALHIPPAMGRMERIARLAALIPSSSVVLESQRIMLARDLGALMDEFDRAQIPLHHLEHVVPDTYAEHWQAVLTVLKIAIREWPRELERLGKQNPVARRNQLVAALIAHWQEHPPTTPIIAAGSTASTKATADLLAAIAALPRGEVILPLGAVSEAYWQAVDMAHPYYFLKQFLVRTPPSFTLPDKGEGNERSALFLSALAPPAMIPQWQEEALDIAKATEGITLLEFENEYEEARAVALIAREALEQPHKRVMVVTQSRDHAALIAGSLKRHGIEADASHGLSLLQTEVVTFLRLTLACAEQMSAVPLLALLKHPLAFAGTERITCLQAAREMDLALRGYAVRDVIAALEHSSTLSADAHALLQLVQQTLAPFSRALARPHVPLQELFSLHIGAAESLAGEVWSGEQGQAVADILAELAQSLPHVGAVEGALYGSIFQEFLAQEYYQSPYGTHPRISILSSQEARLLSADVVIMAGLVEGQFPAVLPPNPWMGRHMMESIGLQLPETVASRTAHDVLMLSHAPQLVLSRARHTDGAPVEPSRYLTRLELYIKSRDEALLAPLKDSRYHRLLKALDAAVPQAATPPAPVPPVALRPRAFSVSDVEDLMRDPYRIYAKYMLKLTPLEALQREPDAALFGMVMHRLLERCAPVPPEVERYRAVADEVMREVVHQPAVVALWQPRIHALIDELVALEQLRRTQIATLKAETPLSKTWGNVSLRTRVDRLEERRDGTWSVVDYKSYTPPTESSVRGGASPQLPLMAMVVEALTGKPVATLEYWNVSGRAALAPQVTAYDDALRASAHAGFTALMDHFMHPETAYFAARDGGGFNRYAHLERVAEWG